jgi:hypothetical protein
MTRSEISQDTLDRFAYWAHLNATMPRHDTQPPKPDPSIARAKFEAVRPIFGDDSVGFRLATILFGDAGIELTPEYAADYLSWFEPSDHLVTSDCEYPVTIPNPNPNRAE